VPPATGDPARGAGKAQRAGSAAHREPAPNRERDHPLSDNTGCA